MYPSTRQLASRFTYLRTRVQRNISQLNFLVSCKQRSITPNFINVKIKPFNRFTSKIRERAERSVLCSVIKEKRSTIAHNEAELYELHLDLSNNLTPIEWSHLDNCSFAFGQEERKRHADRLNTKIDSLRSTELKKNKKVTEGNGEEINVSESPLKLINNKKVVNLSSIELSQSEIEVLSLGLNFAIKLNRVDKLNLASTLESSLFYLCATADKANESRNFITKTLKQSNYNSKSNLSLNENQVLRKIVSYDNLRITKSDKGGQIVVLDKHHYHDEILNLLKDECYKKLKKNPLETYHTKVKKHLKSCNTLDPVTIRKLIPKNYQPPRLYALPKTHKEKLKFRPIVSNVGTSNHKIAQLIAKKFSHFMKLNTYTVSNSKEFVDIIKVLKLNEPDLLASFDVVSLFTKVPVDEAIDCFENRLINANLSAIEINDIITLTKLCVESPFFVYDGQYYEQTDGLPMGSPLSPLLADIFLDYIECKALNNYHEKPLIWIRYVDDIFLIWNFGKDSLATFHNYLNKQHPKIEFTLELMCNNSLPFLDVHVKKVNNHIETSVYRKPFSVTTIPHNRSSHPLSQKMSSFYTLIYRALHICSNETYLNSELDFLKLVALDRGFNPNVVDKARQKFISSNDVAKRTTLKAFDKNNPIVCLPFYPILSSKIANNFKTTYNCNIAFRPIKKIADLLKSLKDPIKREDKPGIYSFKCECNKEYIGQTERSLNKRGKEHMADIKHKRVEKSALANHIVETNHEINLDSGTLIKHCKKPIELDIFEAYYIKKSIDNKICLNRDLGPGVEKLNNWRKLLF